LVHAISLRVVEWAPQCPRAGTVSRADSALADPVLVSKAERRCGRRRQAGSRARSKALVSGQSLCGWSRQGEVLSACRDDSASTSPRGNKGLSGKDWLMNTQHTRFAQANAPVAALVDFRAGLFRCPACR